MTVSLLASRADADAELTGHPLRADSAEALGGATPALSAIAAFALGVAVTAGLAATFEAGYVAGHGADPRPVSN